MLEDMVPFSRYVIHRFPGLTGRAIQHFVQTVEKAVGMRARVDASAVPYRQPELIPLFALAAQLQRTGVIDSFGKSARLPDEPRMHMWQATYGKENAGGMSVLSDASALTAALAECVERKIWAEELDYLSRTVTKTVHDMKKLNCVLPEHFSALSEEQRESVPAQIDTTSTFLWTRGLSLISNTHIYIPAQVISKKHGAAAIKSRSEPMIRPIITTGLATGVRRENALLSGALEIIERDAFMIMWFNQLSLPHINVADLCARSTSLTTCIARCAQYRLNVTFVRLITDAPTYVICAVVKDDANMPPIAVGISAHYDPAHAAEKALLEALRARLNTRKRLKENSTHTYTDPRKIIHWERTLYWADTERVQKLAFLTSGPAIPLTEEAWLSDDTQQHLARISSWCKERQYECAEVNMSHSSSNKTSWYVTFVVIPQLLPLHLNESMPCLGGNRMSTVPRQFGFEPRPTPFVSEPHPFV